MRHNSDTSEDKKKKQNTKETQVPEKKKDTEEGMVKYGVPDEDLDEKETRKK